MLDIYCFLVRLISGQCPLLVTFGNRKLTRSLPWPLITTQNLVLIFLSQVVGASWLVYCVQLALPFGYEYKPLAFINLLATTHHMLSVTHKSTWANVFYHVQFSLESTVEMVVPIVGRQCVMVFFFKLKKQLSCGLYADEVMGELPFVFKGSYREVFKAVRNLTQILLWCCESIALHLERLHQEACKVVRTQTQLVGV